MRNELDSAQHDYKKFTDCSHHPLTFKVGDQVWLNCKNIKTLRPHFKLDYKRFGLFKVLECVGPLAYHLDLPASLSRIHPVFHVSLLSPVSPNEFDGCVSLLPPPI